MGPFPVVNILGFVVFFQFGQNFSQPAIIFSSFFMFLCLNQSKKTSKQNDYRQFKIVLIEEHQRSISA